MELIDFLAENMDPKEFKNLISAEKRGFNRWYQTFAQDLLEEVESIKEKNKHEQEEIDRELRKRRKARSKKEKQKIKDAEDLKMAKKLEKQRRLKKYREKTRENEQDASSDEEFSD